MQAPVRRAAVNLGIPSEAEGSLRLFLSVTTPQSHAGAGKARCGLPGRPERSAAKSALERVAQEPLSESPRPMQASLRGAAVDLVELSR
jgi:hypothetical protein